MDYDDNEFQGQNPHVGGEASSKFSPVQHPYVLPRFDFDDGLQGHLRFDSLVENEVFLGIPSQEDNQWIEDFSRGSGGIVFSSSAPESCPILRRHNVWSEAASSESVEMLLKSVGQEETASIVEESDACQKLGSIAEQMESHLKENKENESVMDVTDADLALLSEKVADHGSRRIDVGGVSNSPAVETSTLGRAHSSSPNASSETCGVYGSGDDIHKKDGKESLSGVDTSLNESPVNGVQPPLESNVPTGDTDSTSQDVIVSTGGLADQRSANSGTDVGYDSANCMLTGGVKTVEEDTVLSKEVDVDGQILKGIGAETANNDLKNLPCSSSNAETVELCPVEINVCKLDAPSSSTVTGSGHLHMAEECVQDVCTSELGKGSECENVDSSDMTNIYEQVDGNIKNESPAVLQGDVNLATHAIEVSAGKDEISAGSKLKLSPTTTDSCLKDEIDLLQGSDCQLGTEASICNDQASLLSNLKDKVSDAQGDGSSISYTVEQSGETRPCSPALIQNGKGLIEKSNISNDARGVHQGSGGEDHDSSPVASTLITNQTIVQHDQDVSSDRKGKTMFPTDSSEMEREIIEPLGQEKQVELSFEEEKSAVNNEGFCRLQRAADARIEPDGAVETLPSFYERGVCDDSVVDDTSHNLTTEKAASLATKSMPLKETSQSSGNIDPVLEIEKVSSNKFVEKKSQKNADQSLPVDGTLNTSSGQTGAIMNLIASQPLLVETSSTVIQAGHAEKTHQISESFSNKLESCRTAEVSDMLANPEAVGKHHGVASAEVSVDAEDAVKKTSVKSVPPTGSVEPALKEARQTVVAKDDKSFTFEVHLSGGVVGKSGRDGQFFSTTKASKSPKEALPLTPKVSPTEPKTVSELSPGSSQSLDLEIAHGGLTGTSVRRRGRSSVKATGKQNAKKGNSSRETSSMRQSARDDTLGSVSAGLSGTGKPIQFEAVKLHEKFEQSSVVPYAGVSVATPNLPDLNTSTSPSTVFRQPFSDLQQMQLRAQIFVYGSLIQGAAPDEACMVAAFGTSDGGRSVWEPVWRACVERLQGPKSSVSKCENPLQLQSGVNPAEQSTKKDALQSSVLPSPAGRAITKSTPSPVVSSMLPLSSPLWSVSTPLHGLPSSGMPRPGLLDYRQTLSPAHPFQTPPTKNFAGNSTSWPSHASFPAPWINSSQTSSFDAGAHLPIMGTLKLTPAKESAPLASSGPKHALPSTTVQYPSPSVSAEASPLSDVKQTVLTYGQKCTEPKSRKRKKSTVSENPIQIPLLAQTRTEPLPSVVVPSHLSASVIVSTPPFFSSKGNDVKTPVVPSHMSASAVVSTPPFFGSKGNDAITSVAPSHMSTSVVSTPPLFGSRANDAKIVATASPVHVADHTKRIESNVEQKSKFHEDAFNKAEVAKQQAEDAAALAAAAVSHSQIIWDQLDKQKSAGLIPEAEAKLASAAVAVAAAAAVAKAAAAAAQIASNAASQAKMMAEEAWNSNGANNPTISNAAYLSNVGNNVGLATSSSIFKIGEEGNPSNSILTAAKEASRKRVEAASFASKRAENLDSIVKAAELAAAAVSQAGRVVAMADPPSLVKLVAAGPEGYWRAPEDHPELRREECPGVGTTEEASGVPGSHANEEPSKKKAKAITCGMSPLSREIFKDPTEDYTTTVKGMPNLVTTTEKDIRAQSDSQASDLDKTIWVVPESESGSRCAAITDRDDVKRGIGTLKGNSIKEGCLVEVRREGNGFKEAWFSGSILSLKDGKALVSYAGSKSGDVEWTVFGRLGIQDVWS